MSESQYEKTDEKTETSPEKEKPWWSEVFKDVTAAGLATLFMTEEGIRGALRDKKLPKEIAALLLEGLSKKKDNLYEMMVKEFGKMLSKIDLQKELQKFLENHEMEIQAKVKFKKRGTHHEDSHSDS